MRRVYENLLRLYPYDYRALFAAEMLTVFEKSGAERRELGFAAYICFAAAEMFGVVRGAAFEWIAKHTGGGFVRGRALPDRRRMRPAGGGGIVLSGFVGERA